VLCACRSTPENEPAPKKTQDQITLDQFRDLITAGALKPVEINDNPDAFKDPHPDSGDPFQEATKKAAAVDNAAVAAATGTTAAAVAAQNAGGPPAAPPQPAQGAAPTAAAPPSAAPPPAAPAAGATGAAGTAAANPPAAQAAAPAGAKPPETPPPGAQAPAAKPPEPPQPVSKPGDAAQTKLVEQAWSENPYLLFGKRIQVYPSSGLIMKPYPLRVGTGQPLKDLLETYGNFPLWQPGSAPQNPNQVRIELKAKWDTELFADLRAPLADEGKPVGMADWLLVTTGLEHMKEVEDFINIFAASVPQIEIEAKIVEINTTDTLDVGVKPIDNATPIFGFPSHTFFRSFNYNLPNQASSGNVNSILQLGAVQDGIKFNIALQALAENQNVSIISRPKIAVREGGTAQIINTVKIPVYNVNGIGNTGAFSAGLAYEEVGIKLFVVPRVVGTQTVALNIDVEASQQSGTAVTFTIPGGGTLTNPQISKRAAKTIVYLEPGQAVILGGLISERTEDTVNKVPLLGDIPLLGYLFKSTFKQKQQTNVLFFIHPRILQGSDLNREF
jgi:type II secretory pathway component GspD/PulD (secretin)